MPLPLLACLVITSPTFSSPVSGPDMSRLAGTYKLSVSEEALSTSRAMGVPAPNAQIALLPNSTFVFSRLRNGTAQDLAGHFALRDGQLVLGFDGASPFENRNLSAHLDNDRLVLDGLTYLKTAKLSINGAWNVVSNGKANRSIQMIFGKDGSFKFAMSNASSKGKYEIEDHRLTLIWTEVDGEKVEFGSMKRALLLSDDGSSFNIDTFRYEREN